MEKLLSVIVPVYNAEPYLKQCVESLLAAITDEMEIILVNDGSKDRSKEMCDAFSAQDERIIVIHQENAGSAAARKTGLKQASGTYITFVDSDDWIDEATYREMLGKMTEYQADICICDMVRYTKDGMIKLPTYVEEGFYNKERLKTDFYPRMLFDAAVGLPAIHPSLCNKIIRRTVLERSVLQVNETIAFGEDALCSFPLMLDADSIYVCKKGFYYYRENPESVTGGYDPTLLEKNLLLYDELKRLFSERGYDLQEQIDGYTSRISLFCIRKELLSNQKASVLQRIKTVKAYVTEEKIGQAIRKTVDSIQDKRMRLKLQLICKRRFFLLFLFFWGTECIEGLRRK